jgi:alkanesulfonate monooxygenase SsuD/methylene tetrahydromethanopterin reductase-like flavin-dependent oxidoreductase (luciferase family)
MTKRGIKMKFGLQFRPQDPPHGKKLAERWEQLLAAARVAEESGFHGVFVPEHHMIPDGYPPSVWGPLGALAAVTKRVEIGTAMHLPVLDHPIHVAEHAALVDIISKGRLRLGIGMGNHGPEFELYGLNPRSQRSRFEECIELIQRAWSGEYIEHEGKHFTVKGQVFPRPIGAELWMGAMSVPGVRRAARYGLPYATDGLHSYDVIKYWTDEYRAAGAEFGTTDELRPVLIREAWVADSLEAVERDWWPHVRRDHWFYVNMDRFCREREPALDGVEREEDLTFERYHPDRLFVGSPTQVIACIERFHEMMGNDYVIMALRMASGPSFEKELECIRRIGREVIPAFA